MTPEMRNAHLASLVIGAPGAATGGGGGGGAAGFQPGGLVQAAGDREAIIPIGARGALGVPAAAPVAPGASFTVPVPAPAAPAAADAAPAPAATPAPAPAAPAAAAPPAPPADPAAAERARIAGILAAPEATGREALAQHLALNTALDATTARAILAASPAAVAAPAPAAPPQRESLDARMAGVSTPPVGISGAPAVSDPDAAAADFILAAARRARGEDK